MISSEFLDKNVDVERGDWVWIGLAALQTSAPDGWRALGVPEGSYGVACVFDPVTAESGFAANLLIQSYPIFDYQNVVRSVGDYLSADAENPAVTVLRGVAVEFETSSAVAKSISVRIDNEGPSIVQYVEAIVIDGGEPFLIVLTATVPEVDGSFDNPDLRDFISGVNHEIVVMTS